MMDKLYNGQCEHGNPVDGTCGECKQEAHLKDIAELHRLRQENEKLKEDRDLWKQSEATCNKEYKSLLEENERLRAALEEIASGKYGPNFWGSVIRRDIAKEALKQEGSDGFTKR
jgi:cell shape-determining protein MreC